MASSNKSSQSTPEELAAVAVNRMDQSTAFLTANAVLSSQRDADSFEAEAARLAKGKSPDQDTIAALNAAASTLRAAVPVLISGFEQARGSQAPAPKNAALVTGRVYDQNSNIGIANALVLAVDTQGNTLTRTSTDAGGAFSLPVDEKAAAAFTLEIRVGRAIVFTDPRPAKLVVGDRYYRDLPVSTEGSPGGGTAGGGTESGGTESGGTAGQEPAKANARRKRAKS